MGMLRLITHHPLRHLFSLLIAGLFAPNVGIQAAEAQALRYCQIAPNAVSQKESLLQASLQGNTTAQQQYQTVLTQHAQAVFQCRQQNWPKNQAIWLRLYPCDAQPGAIERILDDIVNRGYNQVYLEVFYDGQVLLPAANNPTSWPSVFRAADQRNRDLLAEAIQKGRQRGLKVYAWMFMLNFGYTYTLRTDRQQVLARNGAGETTVTANLDGTTVDDFGESFVNQGFIDPYNPMGRQDYQTLLNSVLQRRPSGVLFDYVRYPKGLGGQSVATRVQDLWIYGDASQKAFLQRATNERGQELIQRFLNQGFVTETDLKQIETLYPDQEEPFWQDEKVLKPLSAIAPLGETLQNQLWRLSVAHAQQGVLDFLGNISQTVQGRGIPAGAVFFPEGNRRIREQGFDSRLQPWTLFSNSIEWHPMAYGVCGNTSCITSQVQTVVSQAQPGTKVIPALAGQWGRAFNNRPSLEQQMQAIRSASPQVQSVSHYSYDWLEPGLTQQRKFCQS
ncbi:MAG: family 10 glycosylhydrolase [Microcoleaceae cyanobacterium]